MEYSGSDWLERHLEATKPGVKMSQLGIDVADLLGELFFGIYHINTKWLDKVDWSNKRFIVISIGWRSWATTDYDELTRLVFLAHHRAIRVDIDAATNKFIRLLFHQRKRGKDGMRCHPTLDEAVARFKSHVSLPEYTDVLEEVKDG